MTFIKGHPNYLSHHSEETKRKISVANSKPKVQKNCIRCGKGFEVWPSHILINHCSKSCAQIGRIAWNKDLKGWRAGEKHPWMPKGKEHWSYGKPKPRGEKSPNWIIDRSQIKGSQERNNPRYKQWRMNVWLRDGFKCQIKNEDCDGRIEAHHILGWAEYVELRYEVNNGITLCHAHHPKKRAEEKRLAPIFKGLVSVSKH